ncbi:hypothetical protein KEM52_005906 [Ascosphaera acerosa]|nr:hypothetical protein KEM52_005906 [Ascosphaera acerosa]
MFSTTAQPVLPPAARVSRRRQRTSSSESQTAKTKPKKQRLQQPEDEQHDAQSQNEPPSDEFYKKSSESWRFVLNSRYGYALALSHSEAVVWPYAPESKALAAEPMRKFDLPNAKHKPNDPLPLGLIVSRSVEDSPGMIVVIPSTGQIILWETIANATVLGLIKPKQSGILGSIPGLFHGEHATQMVNGEPSGILVALSSGRLVHISIRDPQGRAALSVHMLCGVSGPTGSGFLASFRHVFSGSSWKRSIAAIKSGSSLQRGQRDVLVATAAGCLEVWDTRWNQGSSIRTQIDIKQSFIDCGMLLDDSRAMTFEIVDFELVSPQSHEERDHDFMLHLLFATVNNGFRALALARVSITSTGEVAVHRLCYVPHPHEDVDRGMSTPRLCASGAEDLAFIVSASQITLVALRENELDLAEALDEPSAQIETVGLCTAQGHFIEAHVAETPSTHHNVNNCLLMIHRYGVIRLTPSKALNDNGFQPHLAVSAKSRLEQAIFFNASGTSPIRLEDQHLTPISDRDIDRAVFEVGDNILRSSSAQLQSTSPLVGQQLQTRLDALERLTALVQAHHLPVSRETQENLLSGGEKLAAQRALWALEEGYKRLESGRVTRLDLVLASVTEQYRTTSSSNAVDNDHVRQWFIQDTWRAECLVPWILKGIKADSKASSALKADFAMQLHEAAELFLATLETAYKYRDRNAQLYGAIMRDGERQHTSTAQHWTSSAVNIEETSRLLELALNACNKANQRPTTSDTVNSAVTAIRYNLPRIFRVLARMDEERAAWYSAQGEAQLRDQGIDYHVEYVKDRRMHLFKLAGIGLLDVALELAEEFKDMEALVELMSELHLSIRSDQADSAAPANNALRKWKARVDRYFDKFGSAWGEAFFTRRINTDEVDTLFTFHKYQSSITAFLRTHPEYASVSWINDILGETDYASAAQTLRSLAVERETNLWSKRIELSVGKIALLAAVEQSGVQPSSAATSQLLELEDLAELAQIQEVVYDHLAMYKDDLAGKSDRRQHAATRLFAPGLSPETRVLYDILMRALVKMATGIALTAEEMIDLLTLIQTDALVDEQAEVSLNPFGIALRVLSLCRRSERSGGRVEYLEALIWRRCMIRDDWLAISDTTQRGDQEIQDAVRATVLFATMQEVKQEQQERDYKAFVMPPTPEKLCHMPLLEQAAQPGFDRAKQSSLVQCLELEVADLRRFVDEGRLEQWFNWILKDTNTA